MTPAALVALALAVSAASGVPGLLLPRGSRTGERLAVALLAIGAAIGAIAAAGALRPGAATSGLAAPWAVPGGELRIELDGLSALFLLPVFVVSLLGSVYGLAYWRAADRPADSRRLRLFYGLLTAGMGLLIVARNAVLFLAGWEVMAASAFLLITTDDRPAEVRAAGYLYLCASRLGTLALFAMFAVMAAATGGFTFGLAGQQVAETHRGAVFVLALFGFGLKAGLAPLHVWLPAAHASAPSHVSALLSGVLIKTGIYGLVRITSMLPHPPLGWAGALLVLGVVSAVAGVVLALGQHDLKRLLAYHSIENIGIIFLGLAVALAGRSLARYDLVALGLGGALLHVWNHGLFKSLLFLAAGAVHHATHTREIDALGGLARSMPRTAAAFLVGAVAICGLPPLNGLVSELMIYLGLLRAAGAPDGPWWLGAAFAAPALALVGALALACFVKAYGAVFLGLPRSPHAEGLTGRSDAPAAMAGPMAALAVACLAIGLAPAAFAPALDRAVAAWLPASDSGVRLLGRLVPFRAVTGIGLTLVGALVALGLVLWARIARNRRAAAPTWDCGYAAPAARMQYTSSSFAQILVRLFAWMTLPHREPPRVAGYFPAASAFASHVPDATLERVVVPAFRAAGRFSAWMRWFQHGSINAYIAYVLAALLLLHLFRH